MEYRYIPAMVEDIKLAVSDDPELEREEDESDDDYADRLNDSLFASPVTGNDDGSYTCNSRKAMSYVADNIDLMIEAYKELAPESKIVDFDPETADVIIRCYLLGQAIDEYIDEYIDGEC